MAKSGRAASIFSDENIQAMFGHEAAENERPERLRQYYFKSQTYDRLTADLPLRILVGQKGVGKSALFTVAQAENLATGSISLSIRPDDVSSVSSDDTDFNRKITEWKTGLSQIIRRLKTNRLVIYVDDLDRGWNGAKADVHRISALLSALRDLSSADEGLRFRVALRSDVYYAIRTAEESTDKLEGSIVWHSWTNHEILVLLAKRLLTYFDLPFDEEELVHADQGKLAEHLHRVIVPVFRGRGKWREVAIHRVLMTMARQRPRDVVKLCTLAARQAYAHNRDLITTEDLCSVFEEYSQGRIQDAINEHRSELPEIERLLIGMKPVRRSSFSLESYTFKTDKLLEKLKSLSSQGAFRFATGREATPRQLAAFLYKIDFLTARKEMSTEIHRRYFEQNRYLSLDFADFGCDWEIHPAYRWALQPDNTARLFDEIEPTAGP